MDMMTRLITLVLIAITIYVVYQQIVIFLEKKEMNTIFVGAILILVLLLSIAFKPLSYILTVDNLVIKRIAGDILIAKNDIKSAELLKSGTLGTLVRGFGIGGYFGYMGSYYSSKIGWLTMYATRRDNRILITIKDDKKIIITPDETTLAAALII